MIHARRPSKKHFVILISILLAFVLGYWGGSVQLIWRVGERLYALFPKTEVTTSDMIIDVNLRGYYLSVDSEKYDTELSSHFFYVRKRIPVNKAALILVDVWKSHPNDGWLERSREITSTAIYDVLQAARENNMLIIHAPAGRAISDTVSPLENEIVLDSSNWIPDDRELQFILLRHDINTLFYAGFATDRCVLARPYGIERMRSLGYQVILLRDCTTGLEYHDTLEGMWVTQVAIHRIEEAPNSYSCTAEDLIEGFTKE